MSGEMPESERSRSRHVVLTLVACAAVWAVTVGSAQAIAPLSQQFLSSGQIPIGSLVSLHDAAAENVDVATTGNAVNLIGVVISADSSPISLSTQQSNPVQVATTGVVPALVSNINGDVQSGDEITASPVSGVGMKATANVKVVGIAQGDLATSGHTETQSYADSQGQKHSILIGEVPVLVSVSYFYKQPDKTIIPAALQNLANALAGKPVNAVPILISVGIFVVTLVVVVTLIYTMIRSSIISVGRNPMAQAAVYRNLIQLSGLIVIILGVAIVAIYLILTKF